MKPAKTQITHKRGSHPHITRFMRMISRLNYGKNQKHFFYTKDYAIQRYNLGWQSGLSKNDLIGHELGNQTLFYMSDHTKSCTEVLITLDVDVKKSHQTTAQAIAFLNYLKKIKEFKDLTWETSTCGKGQHAYLIIKKGGCYASEVIHALQKFLKKLLPIADHFGVDIEIKGLPSRVKYDEDGCIADLTFGSLCRVPRNIKNALNSPNIRLHDLNKVKLPVPFAAKSVPKCAIPVVSKVKRSTRSTSVVKDNMLDALPMITAEFQKVLIDDPIRQSKNDRHRVVAEDLAIFALLSYAMKEDDLKRMPVRRYRELWGSLFECGCVGRAFNSTRFKIIRDWFSERGQINWIENHYYVGVKKGDKGHCCRWSVSDEIKEFIGEIVEYNTHTPSVLTQIITTPKHVHFTPVFGGTVLDRRRNWMREAENSLDWLYAA